MTRIPMLDEWESYDDQPNERATRRPAPSRTRSTGATAHARFGKRCASKRANAGLHRRTLRRIA